jgi:hypothetical protein
MISSSEKITIWYKLCKEDQRYAQAVHIPVDGIFCDEFSVRMLGPVSEQGGV